MPDLKITIDGLDDAMRALNISQGDIVAAAGKAAALATIAAVKPYPAPSGRAQPFKSNQQRKAFFAKLRSGEITVPYRRTGQLQDAWDWQASGDGATVTNSSPHAAFTIAPQVAYHKGNWKNEQQLAKAAEPAARDAAEMAVVELVTKGG